VIVAVEGTPSKTKVGFKTSETIVAGVIVSVVERETPPAAPVMTAAVELETALVVIVNVVLD